MKAAPAPEAVPARLFMSCVQRGPRLPRPSRACRGSASQLPNRGRSPEIGLKNVGYGPRKAAAAAR
jgi:hypothetical protein